MRKSGLMMPGMIIFTGIGEPEALKGNLQGEFSRRINEKDRLVYHIEEGRIYIAACRGHYDDK